MDTRGTHLLVEIRGASAEALNDAEGLERWLLEAAEHVGVRVLHRAFHRFEPEGVTGFVLLEESHLSIHSWPSQGYAAVDFYTCGAADPRAAVGYLVERLGAAQVEWLSVRRGERKLSSSSDNAPTMSISGEPWPFPNRA